MYVVDYKKGNISKTVRNQNFYSNLHNHVCTTGDLHLVSLWNHYLHVHTEPSSAENNTTSIFFLQQPRNLILQELLTLLLTSVYSYSIHCLWCLTFISLAVSQLQCSNHKGNTGWHVAATILLVNHVENKYHTYLLVPSTTSLWHRYLCVLHFVPWCYLTIGYY